MTKKAVKAMTNEDLIYTLSELMLDYYAPKSTPKNASLICKELQSRGVIEDSDILYEKWFERFRK